jgi:hypothetical protein
VGDNALTVADANVAARIGALSTPAGGSTNKLLTDTQASLTAVGDGTGDKPGVLLEKIRVAAVAAAAITGFATSAKQDITNAALVPDTLGITIVSVAASATIQALLTAASAAISADIKTLTVIPAGDVYVALGGAASATSALLKANVSYSFACKAATDLRFYAAGATNMNVVQEG